MIDIDEFVTNVCTVLHVNKPRVTYTDAGYATKTTLAAISSDGAEIHVRPGMFSPDLFFAIAHELRHVWQKQYKPDILWGYRSSDRISTEEYNLQPAEIDANAFAAVIVVKTFRIKPLFQNQTERVKNRIYNRMSEISKTID